jgi:hypothetical protein
MVEGGLPGCVLVGDWPLPELPLSLLPGGVRFCGLRLERQNQFPSPSGKAVLNQQQHGQKILISSVRNSKYNAFGYKQKMLCPLQCLSACL